MSTAFCLKKILFFSGLGNSASTVSNHCRIFLWLLLIHLVALALGQEVFVALLYGPLLVSLVFGIIKTEINKGLLILQISPFISCVLLEYFNPYDQVADFIRLLTILSLATYSLLLWILIKNLRASQYHKSMIYGVFFLLFLLMIYLITIMEGYSYVFVLFSPKITLVIFLICSIAITAIHLIRDHIPGFVEKHMQGMVDQAEDIRPLLVERIESYFATSPNFLNPCFTFEKLAKEIDMPKSVLSTVLNRNMNKSFYHLLAEKRIEHAKTLLISQHYLFTIEAVVYECGFNSKSSFHKYFKQFVGTTPSDFRDHHLKK